MSRRVVYVLQSNGKEHEKPSVFIESLKDGAITFGVRASGSSLKVARERAQEEFTRVAQFVSREIKNARRREQQMIDEELNDRLAKSVAGVKK